LRARLPHVERALDLSFFPFPHPEDNGSLSGIGVFRRGAHSLHERSEFLLRIALFQLKLASYSTGLL
jgi:hypothetical protein